MTSPTTSIEPSKPTRTKAKAAVSASKSNIVLKLLARSKGASVADLTTATGWQPHSVRALLSGLRKKGVVLIRDVRKSGENCYRIAAVKTKNEAGQPPAARAEWRRVYRSPAPRLTPDLLVRGIAYRLQERTLGGLPAVTISLLEKTARRLRQNEDIDQHTRQRFKPGTRLVRRWNGKTYSVLVTDDGFELANQRFTSLTHIAKEITGAHWSGPRFFGIAGSTGTTGAAAASAKRRALSARVATVTPMTLSAALAARKALS